MADGDASAHYRAAEAFARRVREECGDGVETIVLYGSVARGEQRGRDSDVDLLVVLADDVDQAEYERRVRDLAYDVELARGVVLSLVVLSTAEYREQEGPFFQQVRAEGERLHG